jgi:hypothetical protein
MRTRSQYLIVIVLVAGALVAGAAAQVIPPQGVYRLTDVATFQRGCWDPCDCPLMKPVPVRGTMNLVTPPDEELVWARYKVLDVNWYVMLDGEEVRITGQGVYKISRDLRQRHQLVLDLTIGDEPVAHFDSGIVPVPPSPSSAPSIDILISEHGLVCYDTAIRVAARIVPEKEILPYKLVKSEYQRGCWPPCLCPLFIPEPVTGTFGLVPLPNAPYWWLTDYAVVKVDWRIREETAPTETRVTGAGLYRIGGDFAVQHRLMLFLSFNGEAARWFDSRWVNDPNFPNIDINISLNNFYCYDEVFYLHGRPLKVMSVDIVPDELPVGPS